MLSDKFVVACVFCESTRAAIPQFPVNTTVTDEQRTSIMAAANTTIDLHIGALRAVDKTDLIAAFEDRQSVKKVFDGGDTWADWGEKQSDGDHAHVAVRVYGDDPLDHQNHAKELGQKYGKIFCDDRYCITWAVTTTQDWNDTRTMGLVRFVSSRVPTDSCCCRRHTFRT